jgi:signal peptidase I
MENKPRKAWIAGLLSLIQPGLGHVYNGEIRKAFLIYLLPILLIPGLIFCLHSQFVRIFLTSYAFLISGYYLYVIVDAIRTAKRYNEKYSPKKYNKAIAYIGIFLFVVVINNSLAAVVKYNVIQAFKFLASSMEPTLLNGDHILAARSKSAKNPHKGDLIIFEFPEDPSKDFIKRVVAVGGDIVEVRNKVLHVNGMAMTEPYAAHKDGDTIPANQSPRDFLGPQLIPPGSYFVMGDNRDKSYDSRFWGPVSKDKIKGTVKCIYWSWDKENLEVRWDRVGMKVL